MGNMVWLGTSCTLENMPRTQAPSSLETNSPNKLHLNVCVSVLLNPKIAFHWSAWVRKHWCTFGVEKMSIVKRVFCENWELWTIVGSNEKSEKSVDSPSEQTIRCADISAFVLGQLVRSSWTQLRMNHFLTVSTQQNAPQSFWVHKRHWFYGFLKLTFIFWPISWLTKRMYAKSFTWFLDVCVTVLCLLYPCIYTSQSEHVLRYERFVLWLHSDWYHVYSDPYKTEHSTGNFLWDCPAHLITLIGRIQSLFDTNESTPIHIRN